MTPTDPIAAVTHHDPYPYYAHLVSERAFHRDDSLGLWVATSAQAVTAVLTVHGGSLTLLPSDKGACFRLSLPAAASDAMTVPTLVSVAR